MRTFLRAKIHKAIVTEADVSYVGSITIDEDLLDKVDMREGEKVLVANNTSGARLETYILPGEKGSGRICMNGASAHLMRVGEEIVIMAFEVSDNHIKPKNILVDRSNKFVKFL